LGNWKSFLRARIPVLLKVQTIILKLLGTNFEIIYILEDAFENLEKYSIPKTEVPNPNINSFWLLIG